MSANLRNLAKACCVTAAVSIVSVAVPFLAGVSSAAPTTTPWEPDSNTAPPYGNIQLVDANGVTVKSGSITSQPFAYAVATTGENSTAGGTKATAFFRDPSSSNPPASWAGPQESLATTFNPSSSLTTAGAPATVVADAANGANGTPVVKMNTAAQNDTVAFWAAHNTADSNAAYDNIIYVIIQTSGGNGGNLGTSTYWSTDLGFNTNATGGANVTVAGVSIPPQTWVQLFPFPAAPSSTPTLGLSAASPVASGTSETLTASNVPMSPSGSVVFEDNGATIATVAPSSGSAHFTYTPASGAHSYTASFVPAAASAETGADTSGATLTGSSTSSAVPLTVNAPAQSTTTTLSSNESGGAVVGQSVTYTATVAPTPDAGTVAFTDNTTGISGCGAVPVATSGLNAGQASCTTSYSSVSGSSHTIGAAYGGDASFQGSTASTISQTINPADTSTNLQAQHAPASQGVADQLTATVTAVSPGAGTPAGTVTFKDGTTTLCSGVNTSGGQATCNPTFSTAGSHPLTASFTDTDGNYNDNSNGSLDLTVNPATTTTVSPSTATPVVGQQVTYTATVSSTTSGTITGSVAFIDGSTPISTCTAQPVSGSTTFTATCQVTYTTPGSHTVSATYSGDSNFGGSTSASPASVTVGKGSTTTALALTAPNSTPVTGQSVTFTATVSVTDPASGHPSGGVTFKNGSTTLCNSAALSTTTETATCTVASGLLAANSPYSITGFYGGDTNFAASDNTGAPLSQTIDQAATGTSVAPSANPALTGHAVTYTATVSVTSPGKGTPTGMVTFKDNGSLISCTNAGGQTVSGGKATCTFTYSSGGSHPITAAYAGDSNFSGSTASGFTENIELVTVPGAPTGLTATAEPGKVALHWTAPASNGHSPILHYNVYDSTSPGGEGDPLVASPTGTQYTVTGLKAGTKYYFTVTAVNSVGNSAPSNEMSATPTRVLGYWIAGANGGIYSFGLPFLGSAMHLKAPIAGMAATPNPTGYWLVGSDGGIFAFGTARYHGSLGARRLNAPIVGMASTPDGGGYWLVARDGGVFAFGDARFEGSLGRVHLRAPIVGIADGPNDAGYWLLASDGGVFAFGTARYHGSLGNVHLHSPIVGMGILPGGGGYWLVAGDGGVFTFGSARFHGSLGRVHLTSPIVTMIVTQDGGGYWLMAGDGGVFTFGDATYHGSVPAGGVSVRDIVGGAS